MALTNAERQAAWRERQRERIRDLERKLARAERKNNKSRRPRRKTPADNPVKQVAGAGEHR
jgi:hypothetical protein